MFKLATLILVASSLLLVSCAPIIGSQLVGSGKPATRDYPVDGFTALNINSAFKVHVKSGDAFNVSVTTDDNLMEDVVVKKDGDTLTIALQNNLRPSFRSSIQEANITMPTLSAVQLNGASQLDMSGFGQAEKFTVDLNGASKLNGPVQASSIVVKGSGASQVSLNGSGQSLSVVLDGASRAELGQLAAEQVSAVLNGASQATVNAKTKLDYNLNGASHLLYSGNPTIGEASAQGASRASHQ